MNSWFNAWLPRVTFHSLAITVSVLTYILSTRVERDRRPPSIAIAWVLGLIAVPYAALPLYVFFGRRKVRRRAAPPPGVPSPERFWAESLIGSFGLPPAGPARVRLHADGAASLSALHETIGRARARLDVGTYILRDDALGTAVIDALMQRARAGVRVRLLIDGVGALQLSRGGFRRLRDGGVESAVFSPLLARRTSGPRNLRNHRKLLVADDAILWAGGRNFAGEYFLGTGTTPAWLDLTFDLEGAVAAAAAAQFEADWVDAGGRPAARLDPPPVTSGGRSQFVPSGPDQTEDTVQALLIDACYHARERLLAVTPYFIPDTNLGTAMRLAARRGVRIDLCIPAVSNHPLADFVRNRALRSLVNAGAAVHLLPDMVHAKAVVFDSTLALCGSVNLDSRSLLLNYESAVAFYDAREIDWLAAWIGALIPGAAGFDARPPGLLRDLSEGVLLTMAYQL